MIIDPQIVHTAIDLLSKYKGGSQQGERLDKEEFLEKIFSETTIHEDAAELFLRILKYENLLDVILNDYHSSRRRYCPKGTNDYSFHLVIVYYVVIELKMENLEKVINLLVALNVKKALAISSYMKKPDFLLKLFKWGAQIWDIEYVRDLLKNVTQEATIKELYQGLKEIVKAEKIAKQKKLTKPMDMQVLKRTKKTDIPQITNEGYTAYIPEFPDTSAHQAEIFIKPTPVPRTTYTKPRYEKKLQENRVKHQEQAKELYDEAQRNAFRVANLKRTKEEHNVVQYSEKQRPKVQPRKISIKNEPSIQPKTTATVILREGARLMKIEQDEIKRLEDIMNGAFNSESLKALEREIQEERTIKEMEEIEKKHLQGLLTYEESLIAKQKYLKKTKDRADELRREKEVWMKQLDEWKSIEQIRIQESVQKGKEFEKGVKDAVEHVKEEKHRIAMETMQESRQLKEKWLREREEELKKKIQIIKEIKALQAFGLVKRKETLANATASIGLLCEMSTEELKERLMILQLEVKEEIEKRRQDIRQRKECRKAIVDGYRDLIQQHQAIRSKYKLNNVRQCKTKPKSPVKSSSVEELKKKLHEKRRARLHSLTLSNS